MYFTKLAIAEGDFERTRMMENFKFLFAQKTSNEISFPWKFNMDKRGSFFTHFQISHVDDQKKKIKKMKERWEEIVYIHKVGFEKDGYIFMDGTWPPKGMNNYSYLYYLLSNDSTFPWSEKENEKGFENTMVKWWCDR